MATLVKSPSKSPSPVQVTTSPTSPPPTTSVVVVGGKQRQPLKTSLSVDAGKGKTSMAPSSPRTTAAPTTVVTKVSMEGAAGSGTRPPHMPLSATASLSLSATAAQSTVVRTAAPPTPLPRTKRLSKRKNGTSIPPDKIITTTTTATPRRNFSKINRKGSQVLLSELHRPCLQHSFITEVTDVQQMEQGLLHLLDDFHSGKLQAFGTDCSFQKMDSIREQQERLARLHFDMGSQQEAYGTLSEEGQAVAKDHLAKLMTQLHELSTAIEQLQSSTSNSSLHTEV